MVKHGTSLSRIQSILQDGLVPAAERNGDRSLIELPPEVAGVYVGELTAYFGAYANYAAEVSPCLDHPVVEQAAVLSAVRPSQIRNLDLPQLPLTLPLVITVELQEDCELLADEDYVLDGSYPVEQAVPIQLLEDEAESVWRRWRSGVITREIPTEWFRQIEHPRLANLDGSLEVHRQTFSDCELLAAGLMQSSNRETPDVLIPAYVRRYGKLELSQRIAPQPKAIDALVANKALADNGNRLFNHLRLFAVMEVMAKQYGIKMLRQIGNHLVWS